MFGGLVEGEPKLEFIYILAHPVSCLPLSALEGLLDVSRGAEGSVQWFPPFLLLDMLLLVEPDDVVIVSVPLEGLVGGELLLEVGRVLPNHSYKFIVEYRKYQTRQGLQGGSEIYNGGLIVIWTEG